MHWIGYKAHLSETCDSDAPHLITDVTTTSATTLDMATTAPIQQSLADHDRLPDVQFMDAGYVDTDGLVVRQRQHQVTICGPVMVETSWQARAAKALPRGLASLTGRHTKLPGHRARAARDGKQT